jgi:hypothetical protein
MAYLVLLLLLIGVVWLVSAPLRRRGAGADPDEQPGSESMDRIDLEAARDAKYREIRDTELDHETGKLSDEDFAAIDSNLRAEAIEILHRLDALEPDPLAEDAAPQPE